MEKRFFTNSPEETEIAGKEIAKLLKATDVVFLHGDLGAGKTALVRGVASYFAPNAHVQSPTFAIVNHYEGEIDLFHFDLYRLEDGDALTSVGFDEYLERGGICLIEWAERAQDVSPTVEIDIDIMGEDMRVITFKGRETC